MTERSISRDWHRFLATHQGGYQHYVSVQADDREEARGHARDLLHRSGYRDDFRLRAIPERRS